MKILLCLDYSSVTEQILETAKPVIDSFKDPQVGVLHVIDETLFTSTTGFETRLGELLNKESEELKEMCQRYLGKGVKYFEEYGIPRLVIEQALEETDHDLLVIGRRSRQGLGARLMGSLAEHIVRISKQPVLIIP